MGVTEVSHLFGGKQEGIPYPAKLAEKATSHAVTGGDTPVPSIRSESIVFAKLSPDHLFFNTFVSCNRVVGHRHFPVDTIRRYSKIEMVSFPYLPSRAFVN